MDTKQLHHLTVAFRVKGHCLLNKLTLKIKNDSQMNSSLIELDFFPCRKTFDKNQGSSYLQSFEFQRDKVLCCEFWMRPVQRFWLRDNVQHIRLVIEKEVSWLRTGEDILPTQLLHAAHFQFFSHHLHELSHKRLTFICDQDEAAFHILLHVEACFHARLHKSTADGP